MNDVCRFPSTGFSDGKDRSLSNLVLFQVDRKVVVIWLTSQVLPPPYEDSDRRGLYLSTGVGVVSSRLIPRCTPDCANVSDRSRTRTAPAQREGTKTAYTSTPVGPSILPRGE